MRLNTRENVIEECQRGVALAEELIQGETAYIMVRGIAENAVKRMVEIREMCQNAEDISMLDIGMLDIEITKIVLLLKKLKYNQIGNQLLTQLEQCREYVRQAKADIENAQFDFFDELKQQIKELHPGKIRKIINENAYGSTISSELNMLTFGETAFNKKCKNAKDQLVTRIERLFDKESVDEVLCMTAILEQIGVIYQEYCSKNQSHFRDCISDCLNGNEIWSRLQAYWGGENHYSEEIAEELKKELVRQSIEMKLGKENYYMDYVNEMEAFLNVPQ